MQVENLDRLEEHANNPETTIEELADQVKTISINVRGALGEGLEAHRNMLARSRQAPARPDVNLPEIPPTQSPPRRKRWRQGHFSARQPQQVIYDQPSPPSPPLHPPAQRHTCHASSPAYQEPPPSHRHESPLFDGLTAFLSGGGTSSSFYDGGTSATLDVPESSSRLSQNFGYPDLSLGVSLSQHNFSSFGGFSSSAYYSGGSSARPASLDIAESSSRLPQIPFLDLLTDPDYTVQHDMPPVHFSQHDMPPPDSQTFSQADMHPPQTFFSPPFLHNRNTLNPPNRYTPG